MMYYAFFIECGQSEWPSRVSVNMDFPMFTWLTIVSSRYNRGSLAGRVIFKKVKFYIPLLFHEKNLYKTD